MKKWLGLLLAGSLLLSACTSLVPVINTFTVSPAGIMAGNTATLSWNVTGVNSVIIEPGPGSVAASGSQIVNPMETTAYTITASGPVGSVSKSVVLTVKSNPISIMIGANPLVLIGGGSTLLQWNVSGADTVSIDQGIGNVPPAGSQLISPSQTTTYTISARNVSGSTSRSVTIAVNPPVEGDFIITPSTISPGQSATLSWNISGANTVTIDQGIGTVPATGTRRVSPTTTTSYTLTAQSSCCLISKAATVTVGTVYPYRTMFGYGMYGMFNDPNYYYNYYPFGGMYSPYWSQGGNQTITPFIEIFNVTPNTVQSGKPVLLHWNVVNATSVEITGIGNVAANGSRIVVPAGTTTYVLTARNGYADSTSSVTVTVVP